MLLTIAVFLLILSVLVLVHEFGHYIVARLNGVLVEEFGIGFPPKLFSIKIGETKYSVNLIPLGGFVRLYGDGAGGEGGEIDPKLKHRAFANKKPAAKVAILLAGIVMNFFLGSVIMSVLATQGLPVETGIVKISEVAPNSPAALAGLTKDLVIKKIIAGGKEITVSDSRIFITAIQEQKGKPVIVIAEDVNKNQITYTLTPRLNPPKGEGAIGVALSSTELKKYTWYEAPFAGLREAANITATIARELFKTIGLLVTLQKPAVDVAGPVGIAKIAGEAVNYGFFAVLNFTAVLSLNLAVLNILPFPALDGGRLVVILYEWISRRKVNVTFERYLNVVGIVTLLGLSLVVTVFDVIKLFK